MILTQMIIFTTLWILHSLIRSNLKPIDDGQITIEKWILVSIGYAIHIMTITYDPSLHVTSVPTVSENPYVDVNVFSALLQTLDEIANGEIFKQCVRLILFSPVFLSSSLIITVFLELIETFIVSIIKGVWKLHEDNPERFFECICGVDGNEKRIVKKTIPINPVHTKTNQFDQHHNTQYKSHLNNQLRMRNGNNHHKTTRGRRNH
nr:hypothetical protein [Moritella viscosa]SHO14663.1 Putative uncharacterized protein [Moritella viscosa]